MGGGEEEVVVEGYYQVARIYQREGWYREPTERMDQSSRIFHSLLDCTPGLG